MASNRHLGRIIALQTLYEQDFRRGSHDTDFDLKAVLERNIARYEATVDDTDFIANLVNGVAAQEQELDVILQPLAPEWPIDQIARMDRVILRMGAYELTQSQGVPPKVVINEAVELAKAFGSENSSKFINGVLGTLLRQQNGEPVTPVTAKSGDDAAVAPDATVATSDGNADATAVVDDASTTSTAVSDTATTDASTAAPVANPDDTTVDDTLANSANVLDDNSKKTATPQVAPSDESKETP